MKKILIVLIFILLSGFASAIIDSAKITISDVRYKKATYPGSDIFSFKVKNLNDEPILSNQYKIFFTGNPSGSFVYVLSALHLAHLAGGIIYLLVVITKSIMRKYSSENNLQVQLCAIYWHFLDILWVYLFIFLLIVR